jgi:hypothetical protein
MMGAKFIEFLNKYRVVAKFSEKLPFCTCISVNRPIGNSNHEYEKFGCRKK